MNKKAKALSDRYEASYESMVRKGMGKDVALRASRAAIARRLGKKGSK